MNLEQELAGWDGKSSADIEAIYQRHAGSRNFIKNLLRLIRDGREQTGATWILKYYVGSGGRLCAEDIQTVYRRLPKLDHWQARLHILQSMPYMTVGPAELELVTAFVRKGLTDRNRFVRAWSYNALYELALACPDLRIEMRQVLEMGLQDEAASVKARIRNILKKGLDFG